MKRFLALATLLLVATTACAKKSGTTSSEGDWEGALDRYKQAYARNPEQASIARKLESAKAKVIEAHAAKGFRAREQGWLVDAGTHFGKAYSLCSVRVAPPACAEIGGVLKRDASAFELSADEAAKRGEWEEAAAVYDAILLASPNRAAVAEKNADAQRELAAALQDRADELQKRRMFGAAWAMNVRALTHDPMHPDAFRAGSALEKSIRSRAKVAVQDVTVDAKKGDRAFGNAVARVIRPRLDDVKPYGPTRDPKATKARFTAKVVKLDRRDVIVKGVEKKANEDRTPLPNPAIAAQKKKIARLQGSLAALNKQKKGPKRTKKIELVKKQIATAKAAMAKLPATVEAPETFDLPWRDVTRSVVATVRFELRESDFAEPLTLEVTRKIEKTDRTHKGNAKHGIMADPLTLPSNDALALELVPGFGEGATLLEAAFDRRVKSRLDTGRTSLASGNREKALDAFVEVLFLAGPAALTDDQAAFVARSTRRDELRTLLASN